MDVRELLQRIEDEVDADLNKTASTEPAGERSSDVSQLADAMNKCAASLEGAIKRSDDRIDKALKDVLVSPASSGQMASRQDSISRLQAAGVIQ